MDFDANGSPRTVARLIAEYLARRGVRRVYGLCGGHIQPIWDEAARLGIRIVDVRHESAAVYMAQAEAELTGSMGVAMVTAGPGLTNAMTGIANASVARSPVLVISGRAPAPRQVWAPCKTYPRPTSSARCAAGSRSSPRGTTCSRGWRPPAGRPRASAPRPAPPT